MKYRHFIYLSKFNIKDKVIFGTLSHSMIFNDPFEIMEHYIQYISEHFWANYYTA